MASEVLKVKLHATLSNSEADILTVANGKTATILSITLCETGAAAETFDLLIDDGGGGSDTYIYKVQALGANETFEHTGKFVIEGTDHLCARTASAAAVDVVVSYLDQTL